MMRRIRTILIALLSGAALGLLALAWFFPVLRGAACPPCAGLERAEAGLWVEAEMPEHARAALAAQIRAARGRVADFYGPPQARLIVLACMSDACDRRLGGRGAAAVTYSLGAHSVVRIAPQGLSPVVLTHEFAHTETHARLGVFAQITGRMATWFDEGLSVLISNDPQYLRPGFGPGRCLAAPPAELPKTPHSWARQAARDPTLYAQAACAVLLWAGANGGLAQIHTELAQGRRLP